MEHWVSEVIHIDLQDPDARTPFLMVMVDVLISLELKDLRRELSHTFWCSREVWGRLPSLCQTSSGGHNPIPSCGILGSQVVTLVIKEV